MTTRKTIALTIWTFVGKIMSLLLNMLSRLVITFLLRSKRLLISWLQSPSAVILEPRKIKSDTVSTVSPSICHEVMGPDAMIFVKDQGMISQGTRCLSWAPVSHFLAVWPWARQFLPLSLILHWKVGLMMPQWSEGGNMNEIISCGAFQHWVSPRRWSFRGF